MSCAVVLTALSIEYLAVRKHLVDLQEMIDPQGSIYERGNFVADGGEVWEVGIAEVGAGNAESAVKAERAISYFNPDILFFVGIAGGIKDVDIGDVVAAIEVYSYESGKVGDQFSSRPKSIKSAHLLVERAKAEKRKGEWLKRISVNPGLQPNVFVAPIVAGEKVVVSRESNVFQLWRTNYNDAIAVEMEGFGFLSAAFAYTNIKAIVIRGISDLVEGKNDDSTESEQIRQEKASNHASAFAFEILAKLNFSKIDGIIAQPIQDEKNLEEQHPSSDINNTSQNLIVSASTLSKVIAILPFQYNRTGKLDNILADGFCDGIIRRLSRLNGLSIISTESTQALLQSDIPATEIGRQLQAQMVIVGSIREFGDRLILTVKLIDVQSSAVTWISGDDDSYEFGYDELAKAQRDVVRSIAEELAIHLTSVDEGTLERRTAINPVAYEHYVRASGLYTTNQQKDLENVLSLLETAIKLDNKFADAYALKGYALWRKYFSGWNADIDSLNQAISFTQEALKLNPSSITAKMSLIRIYWDLGKSEEALEQGKKVLAEAPESNEALIAMARAYNNAGMADCSLPLVQKVLNIDPTHPTASKLLICSYVMIEKYSEACKAAESYFSRNLEDANTSWAAVMAYIHLGEFKKATDLTRIRLKSNPSDFVLLCLHGYIYQLQNKEEDALSVWKDGAETLLKTQPERNYRARVWLAIIYAAMQDHDSALREASIIESANSTNGYLLYRLTNVYSELGLFEQSLSSLENAINSGFTSIQLMRREELVYMKKISNHPKYKNLASNLEDNVDQLKKKFQVYIT